METQTVGSVNFGELIYLGIDVGGTNIKIGVVSDAGEVIARSQIPTEASRGPEAAIENIRVAVEKTVSSSPLSFEQIAAIGIATPGTMDIPAGMLLDPPNLPGWQDFPIRARIEETFQKPTVLQNDANAAAYGEYWVGAGRKTHSMILWTLGTGIGCGIIVQDMIIQGEHSHGSECGHIIIEMDNGRYCDTGQYGTLEAYAGAKALVRRVQEVMKNGRETLLAEWVREGRELSPLLIAQAAEEEDALADEVIMEAARCLGVGTTSLMHTIDPNMVLFGGAMTFGRHEKELGRRFLKRIQDEVKTRAFPVPAQKTLIDFASLGGAAGFIGAAGCARRAMAES